MKTHRDIVAAVRAVVERQAEQAIQQGRLHHYIAENLGVVELTGDEKQMADEIFRHFIHKGIDETK